MFTLKDVEAYCVTVRRVDKLQSWLASSCSSRKLYEQCVDRRHPKTCKGFLNRIEYTAWKSNAFDPSLANDTEGLERDWQDRVLFVQGMFNFLKYLFFSEQNILPSLFYFRKKLVGHSVLRKLAKWACEDLVKYYHKHTPPLDIHIFFQKHQQWIKVY